MRLLPLPLLLGHPAQLVVDRGTLLLDGICIKLAASSEDSSWLSQMGLGYPLVHTAR